MGKSASVIGREFGRNGREMNALLKDHGYLEGHPGAYGLTEKGRQYGQVQDHDNGYGGFAARSWDTLNWNDETAAVLKADMKAKPGGDEAPAACGTEGAAKDDAFEYGPQMAFGNDDQDGEHPGFSWKGLAIAGAVVVGVIVVTPHAKAAWNNKVKPAAQKFRARFPTPEQGEAQPCGIAEEQG